MLCLFITLSQSLSLYLSIHTQILKSARQLGDFLLVGIYTDQTVRYARLLIFLNVDGDGGCGGGGGSSS